jgi:acyl phosphate:glycerol-3-phosphate acyltransferase
MSSWLSLPVASAIGYVMGSLPIGYVLIYLFKGVDLREQGSGRTGGTNAMRAGGLVLGILTALGDLAKGAGTIWIIRSVVANPELLPWAEMAGGALAVIGHNWSIFLGLRGGAGTGPNVGVAIALWPTLGLAVIPAGVVVLLVNGHASVVSLSIAYGIALGMAGKAMAGLGPWQYAGYGLATAIAVTIALLPNIQRLRNGTERLVGPRAKAERRRLEAPKHRP